MRNVDIAQFRISTQHRPGACRTGVEIAAVLPRVGADLAGLRDGIELPDFLARPHIEATDISGHALLVAAASHDNLCHHDVAHHESRRDRADVRHRRALDDALAQVDPAIAAKPCRWLARLRIDRDQAAVGRVVEKPLFGAVGPVGQRARRQRRAASADVHRLRLERPQCLARARLDGGHAVVQPRHVQHTIVQQRRRLVVTRGRVARRICAPAPRDLQPIHRLAVDLVQRRIAGLTSIAAPVDPFG